MLRAIARVSAVLAMIVLVIEPTVLRAREHVEMRDTTRISIRLNWQGDTPPQRGLAAQDHEATTPAIVPLQQMLEPHPARVVARVHVYESPVVRPVFDDAPDLFRGPPSVL